MNSPLHSAIVLSSHLRHEFSGTRTLVSAKLDDQDPARRRRALKKVDRELSKGNYKTALTLVKQLQGKSGGLRGFGAAKQVPWRISSLDQLKLCGIDISSSQALVDLVLNSINRSIEFELSDEVSVLELESLMYDGESYESLCKDHLMCIQHEAGHFLVGYLLGVLPKGYRVSNMETLRQDKFAGGKVDFLGFEFLIEVDTTKILEKNFSRGKLRDGAAKGKISSTTLNKFVCVILGGLAAEHLVFGYSEGLHADVEKLNAVLQWLGFTKSEGDSQVKWAAINTLSILVRHHKARSRLAEAMALGKSVGSCIDVIESTLNDNEI
ncbi:hypothetical protein CEY00_Acc09456 [Actinidia chinensis var. chinensis]|uniref:Uncharacterized protein n=1 Tax=Actinidia chinensis var. chinensis TaxID=1590841 RepID=A0A2R6RBG3_ACTCC|nr:hypothetical protein CEY00_Acc09456 [Actinidia chinensis var. chinensis]